MRKNIFISYRRDDVGGYAIALHAELEKYFGKESVFFDVGGSIKPGENFDAVIRDSLKSCGVLLALIGKNWLSISDGDGRRRLDNPKDYVNIEIATALKHKILVIPVLINDAKMPTESALPDNLRNLCKCQALEIRHSQFKSDAENLMFHLGIGKVMDKIGETVSSTRAMNEAIVIEEGRQLRCPNCGTPRDINLDLPCSLCGSRKYYLIGYIYPREAKIISVIILLVLLLAITSGVIYIIITNLRLMT